MNRLKINLNESPRRIVIKWKNHDTIVLEVTQDTVIDDGATKENRCLSTETDSMTLVIHNYPKISPDNDVKKAQTATNGENREIKDAEVIGQNQNRLKNGDHVIW